MAEVIELVDTKDSSLIGAIGEVAAWKFLGRRRILAHRIGQWYPFPANYPFSRGELSYDLSGLSTEQVDYLRRMCSHGPRRYDFVGQKIKRLPDGIHGLVDENYLVEVKTTGPGIRRHDWQGSMKRKIPEDVEAAKALGFKVLLIKVNLLDGWKCEVTSREL